MTTTATDHNKPPMPEGNNLWTIEDLTNPDLIQQVDGLNELNQIRIAANVSHGPTDSIHLPGSGCSPYGQQPLEGGINLVSALNQQNSALCPPCHHWLRRGNRQRSNPPHHVAIWAIEKALLHQSTSAYRHENWTSPDELEGNLWTRAIPLETPDIVGSWWRAILGGPTRRSERADLGLAGETQERVLIGAYNTYGFTDLGRIEFSCGETIYLHTCGGDSNTAGLWMAVVDRDILDFHCAQNKPRAVQVSLGNLDATTAATIAREAAYLAAGNIADSAAPLFTDDFEDIIRTAAVGALVTHT